MNNMRVGFVDDERCGLHFQSTDHPEQPDRIKVIRESVQGLNLIDIPARKATHLELTSVHYDLYIRQTEDTCARTGFVSGSPDVLVHPDSWISALVAAGGVIEGVKSIVDGKCDYVFCNVRPPGHHSCVNQGSGFCLFNNIALGVAEARKTYEKVLVFDFDTHAGDGSEKIFKSQPNVFFSSMHVEAPFYPNAGFARDNTETNLNIPLKAGTSADDYRRTFTNVFLPRAKVFNPDIIFISCGFDSHKDDPLGKLNLTGDDYAWMISELKKFNKPILGALEGGYNLDALAESVPKVIQELLKPM
jgi:acetoin utilization deacetylase AcuC-like enzyme